MEITVHDTGSNYLLVERSNGVPIRGLVVDKRGYLWDDIESFDTWRPRLGSIEIDGAGSKRLLGKSIHMATIRDGELAEETSIALDDAEWRAYASI